MTWIEFSEPTWDKTVSGSSYTNLQEKMNVVKWKTNKQFYRVHIFLAIGLKMVNVPAILYVVGLCISNTY